MALRLRGNGLCCAGILWILKLLLSHPALGRRALSRRSPPSQPRPSTPPSRLSTIHLRLPRARNVPRDTVGLVPNPLLAHFTRAFTDWPPSRGCCLGFGSKEADRGPSSPPFPRLCFALTLEEAVSWRVKEPWGGQGPPVSSSTQTNTQHYGDVCLCYDSACRPFISPSLPAHTAPSTELLVGSC